MAKKKNNTCECERNENGEEEKAPIRVVLKVHMHCNGCGDKIRKCVLDFPGVETVKVDANLSRVIVIGIVDPCVIREKLQGRIKKEVELICPSPKKEKKPDDDEKSQEPPLRTAVLKVKFHCEGCLGRIRRTVTKTRGVYHVSTDKEKEQVTVMGTMDMEELRERLREKLKRTVEVVSLREVQDDKSDGGERECQRVHYRYGWMPVYIELGCRCNVFPVGLYAPPPPPPPPPPHRPLELLSDENANACSVM